MARLLFKRKKIGQPVVKSAHFGVGEHGASWIPGQVGVLPFSGKIGKPQSFWWSQCVALYLNSVSLKFWGCIFIIVKVVAKNVILALKSKFLDFVFAKLSATHSYRYRVNYHYTAKLCNRAEIRKPWFESKSDRKLMVPIYKHPLEKGQVGSLPRGKLEPHQSRDNLHISLKIRDNFLYQVTINWNKR